MDTNIRKLTLKAIRVNAGLTQREAASQLGVSVTTLSAWENGTVYPKVPDITKIENLYGVTYADIDFLSKNVSE